MSSGSEWGVGAPPGASGVWEPRQGVGCILGTVNLPNGMPRLGTNCQTLRNTKKKQRKLCFVPQNPRQLPKILPFGTQNPAVCTKAMPVCTKKEPTDLAGMDPDKTNMHRQKHPFCQKTTWLPHVCYACGPLCTTKTTWLPHFVLKQP